MLSTLLLLVFSVTAMLYELLAVIHKSEMAVGRSMTCILIQAEMVYKYKRTGKAGLMNLACKQELKQTSGMIGDDSDKICVIFGELD